MPLTLNVIVIFHRNIYPKFLSQIFNCFGSTTNQLLPGSSAGINHIYARKGVPPES